VPEILIPQLYKQPVFIHQIKRLLLVCFTWLPKAKGILNNLKNKKFFTGSIKTNVLYVPKEKTQNVHRYVPRHLIIFILLFSKNILQHCFCVTASTTCLILTTVNNVLGET
jgi:hypothetical protein